MPTPTILSAAQATSLMTAAGVTVPAAITNTLLPTLISTIQKLMFDFIGYDPREATVTEYLPVKQANLRADLDLTNNAFDLNGGVVVPRGVASNQRREIILGRLPVRSITSVYENFAAFNTAGGIWPTESLLAANTYYLDSREAGICWTGILYRNVGSWSVVPHTIKITYASGLSQTELDTDYLIFQQAIMSTLLPAVTNFLMRSRNAVAGFSAGRFSIQDFSVDTAQPNNVGVTGLGSNIGASALTTETMQMLSKYIHMAKLF